MNTPTSSSRASGSTIPPTTPKSSGNPRHHGQRTPNGGLSRQRKAQSSSPQSLNPFASSSVCSSPSARNVPLPPADWLNQLQVPVELSSRPSSSISNTSSASSSTSSLSSSGILESSPPSSPLSRYEKSSGPSDLRSIGAKAGGVRVCPLQLIAAIASA